MTTKNVDPKPKPDQIAASKDELKSVPTKGKKDNPFLKFLSCIWGPILWIIEAAGSPCALAYLKRTVKDELIEHKHYSDKHGADLLEIRNWKWHGTKAG